MRLVKYVKFFLKKIFKLFPLRKYIVFESNPDFSCNTYPVFLQLKKDFPDYKFIWSINKSTENVPNGIDAIFDEKSSKLSEKIKSKFYMNSCKVMISCNCLLKKRNSHQISIFLCHGSKTKKTKGIYEVGDGIDFVNVQSHFFDDIISYEYNCRKNQLVYLGYPRCDYFFKNSGNEAIKEILNSNKGEKFCIWLPTFRKQIIGRIDVSNGCYDQIGMPLIYSTDMLEEINTFLSKIGMHIIFKPHPSQDITNLIEASLSHIHVILDKDLQNLGVQLYEIIAKSKALITDYSSVFFDYLLLDRPIATTMDDVENWKSGRGFAFAVEDLYEKATIRVSNIEELKEFILQVNMNKDVKRIGRNTVKNLTNIYCDGNSAKRVSYFIKEQLKVSD